MKRLWCERCNGNHWRQNCPTLMNKYPDVQMVKCPVRGVVFYADGMGERAYKTPKAAQDAHNHFRQRREATDRELLLSNPNRVECTANGITVYTNGEPVQSIECSGHRQVRQMIGALREWETHVFVWI